MQAAIANRKFFRDDRSAFLIATVGAVLAGSLVYTPVPFALLIAIPFCLYFAKRPYELLLVMVFLIPFNFVFTIGPVPMAAELLKVFAWVPFLLWQRGRKQPLKASKYNWCFAVLAGLVFLSVFRSKDLPFTIKESVRLLSNVGLCYLVLNLVDSREKVFRLFRVLAFSTFLVACYGFYQFTIQDFGGLFWIVNPRLDTGLSHGRDTFWEWRHRITSVLTSEMELGHYFNLCLPVAVVLWLTEVRKTLAAGWFLVVLTIVGGLLLTFTFAAWLSVTVTAGLLVLFLAKRRWKVALAGALIFLVLAGVTTFSPVQSFLVGKIYENSVGGLAWDAYTRWQSWMLALQAWRSHPLIGIGYGSFPSMTVGNLDFLTQDWVSSGSSPHNIYLYLLSELGLVGLATVVFIFFRTVRTNLRLLNTPGLRQIGLGLAFALTTAFIGGCSDDSVLYGPHASYLVWLLIGLSEAVSNLSDINPATFGLPASA